MEKNCNIWKKLNGLYYSIMNSLVIVLFLSGMVAMIMLRTLHKLEWFILQYHEFISNSTVSVWYGGHDYVENSS